MKQNIFRNLATVLALASASQLASANCTPGTPESNKAIVSSIDSKYLHDHWFSTEFDLQYGWDASRGVSDPYNTDLEYNKLMLGAILLGFGIDNAKLDVWQNPGTGKYEYRYGQIDLNPAFHRSGDEWAWLISHIDYRVCDYLNPDNGNFECKKEGKWPTKHYRTFGKKTSDSLFDLVPPEDNPDPSDPFQKSVYSNPKGTRVDNISYFCPVFNTNDGKVDEISPIFVAEQLAREHWVALERGHHINVKKIPGISKIFQFGGFGKEQSAIARDAYDAGIGSWQMSERALCDLTLAHQPWVPLMVVELANVVSNTRMAEPKYTINGKKGQKSPFTCGLSAELLKMTPPGVEVCANGQARCVVDNDCPTLGNYYCSSGCCAVDDSGDVIIK